MTRVKFDYVVSFSSEDPAHPAADLLSSEVTKKKWLCANGEKATCSVVLGVSRAVRISSVTIGAHMSAMVELLVSRSETTDGTFKVLVPSSVFMSPAESRKADGTESGRVRSFHADALCDTRHEAWDRFKLICSQPYNTHCQFGLSFVIMTSSDERAPSPRSALTTEMHSSDDDDTLVPGDMFRTHLESQKNEAHACQEIREATRNAMKNDPQPVTVVKNLIVKKRERSPSPEGRRRPRTLRADDEVAAHRKIDTLLQRHGSDKKQEKTHITDRGGKSRHTTKEKKHQSREDIKDVGNHEKQLQNNDNKDIKMVLDGVVFVLSGYENPLRARLRECAISMGATYSNSWNERCTHLICAFPNTPKLREVRSLSSDAAVCTGDWIQACRSAGTLLPWRPHATEKHLRQTDAECDTDDEIEKVLQQAGDGNARDKQMKCVTDSDEDDTTVEDDETDHAIINDRRRLANFLEGYTLMIDNEVSDAGFDADTLRRYVSAYGGQIIQVPPSERDDRLLVLCTGGTKDDGVGTRLRPDWLWECHQNEQFVDYDKYLI